MQVHSLNTNTTSLSDKYEGLNWSGVQNADLLKGILISLRKRNAQTSFKWVKGHADNHGNNRADALVNTGRESDTLIEIDEEDWLEAKHMYNILLRRDTKDVPLILHQEKLDDAKNRVQQTTGLRPTSEKLLNSIKLLKVPPRLRDHTKNMLLGRIKYWNNIRGYKWRAINRNLSRS